MLWLVLATASVFLLLWLVPWLLLNKAKLEGYDENYDNTPAQLSPAFKQALTDLSGTMSAANGLGARQRIQKMREIFDAMGDRDFGVSIEQTSANGVPAEWLTTQNSDPDRRLLYIHGGAFLMGSPKSHRAITSELAERLNASVLAIDYRLQPENSRMDGIKDTRAAWQWMLDNGPNGASAARETAVAGDSAGGNLSLTLSHWIRDEGLTAPNAVVGLAPLTDAATSSPSMKTNIATDALLGPMLGKITTKPVALLFWFGLISNKMLPSNPDISPVRGNLANLPPTLLQVSTSEMLLDDSVRYVNKAIAAGSPAELQVFNGLMHVFQMLGPDVPEVRDAFDKIERFLNANGFG